MIFRTVTFGLVALLSLPVFPACGQVGSSGKQIVRVLFSSAALRGNLIGDPSEREILVLLPPSYYRTTDRFPVVYYLHGLGRGTLDISAAKGCSDLSSN